MPPASGWGQDLQRWEGLYFGNACCRQGEGGCLRNVGRVGQVKGRGGNDVLMGFAEACALSGLGNVKEIIPTGRCPVLLLMPLRGLVVVASYGTVGRAGCFDFNGLRVGGPGKCHVVTCELRGKVKSFQQLSFTLYQQG